MPRTLPVLFVIAACAISPWPALGQSGLGGIVNSVSMLDRNFDAADKNHDSLLSKDEARAGHVPFIVANFDAIDTRHRGLVSKDEVHDFIKRSLLRNQPAPGSSSK
ncbi:EF-hand domain-containing protein [Rhodanobacter sp. Col0626]|uniref:EF-hand domain-containing protein n=1 Tax=Rhodanobacter sp. Col0626 TaxID=3415679 RepID=UPI003CF640AA